MAAPESTLSSSSSSAFSHLLSGGWASSLALPTAFDLALRTALQEASKGIGRTSPNPPVGCVIVDADGSIVAVGHHEAAGRPHAEVNALDALLAARGPGAARGLTAVVTLEPCAHTGRTPPCTERLIHEGIARVVVGTLDPNPRVCGRGCASLRAAGIEVVIAEGALANACRALIAPFAMTMEAGRAFVVLKTATSLDGRVATRTGASRFITGPVSRALVHALRDAVDAVVVGRGTVIADDPALTVRDHHRQDGIAVRDPRRVILDRRAQLPLTARVFDPPGAWLVHEPNATPRPMAGVESIPVAALDLMELCRVLKERGNSSILVEAGPRLASAFLDAGVVDELWWFHAPIVIGGDGVAAVGSLGVDALTSSVRGDVLHRAACGDDSLTVLRPRR